MDESNEDKKTDDDAEKNSKKAQAETDDSFSLSITPPFPADNKKEENSDESISEHLTSNSASVENDRSYQEIEISNRPANIFYNLSSSDEERQHISQERLPRSLDASFCSDNSVISLNYFDRLAVRNMDVSNNVRSILEEILSNDQFISESEATFNNSKEESLNIFANIDLDDKSLANYRNSDNSLNENFVGGNYALPLFRNNSDVEKRIKDFEELLHIKDSTIAALTSELDSFREFSNTNTGSMVSTTEYKQLQEECHNKLMEYNSAIIYKNDLIHQLSESLDQSISERKDLEKQVDHFVEEIAQLQKQLQDATRMVNEHTCVVPKPSSDETDNVPKNFQGNEKEVCEEKSEGYEPLINLDLEYTNLAKSLNSDQIKLLNELKIKINDFLKQNFETSKSLHEEEIRKLKEKIDLEKEDYESEVSRLRDLLANIKCGSTEIMELKEELEAKHSREVEELRTYFEKKCSDLEKNYSEEIFSQQSRKMSTSTCSEAEMNSDLLFSHPPGPDGDTTYDLQPNMNKKDLINLKNEMNSILNKINAYNLENITEDEFNALKTELSKCNLNSLLKYDLSLIKNDLQNKYHAELEVLREDNENKLDELNVQHENRLKSLERKYLEEIDNMKCQLDEMERHNLSISSAVQEVASSGEFEITEVIQSYERRLQEQVTLAKIDIISALESQIQRLASNEADDEEWPSELLQLRDRFTDKYENEIRNMNVEHEKEIERLKEEHLKILNGALERARRRSLRDNDSLSKGELEILKERDNLKKQVSSLRNLLGELVKYFTQCEDELNNTLVDELLKQGFDKNLSQIEEELNLNDSSATNSSKTGDSFANVTRVHLTPNFSDLINLIESNSQEENETKDISIDLKNELGVCLEKLKQEANAILALTTNIPKPNGSNSNNSKNSLEEKLTSLTRQLISESQAKEKMREELEDALNYVKSLEKEKEGLENQLDEIIAKANMLENDLLQARNKIAELIENGHKEIVSEGYGEEGSTGLQGLGDTMTVLDDLQEKARNMLAQSRASADPTLLQLIEDLCRVGEKIKEESQKERQDLMQQIEVADKKYRTTQKFLEEQAAERELERDEAQKRIDQLCEQLRERDRDRSNCERFTAEVEQLEQQLQELTRALAEETRRCKEHETERDEAVEKIKVLRDIIRELEVQTEAKSKEIEEYLSVIKRLECIVEQQDRSINDLNLSNSLKDVSDVNELRRLISHLENELQQSRVNSELAGSEGALKQIKTQLYEFEITLDKKTKELEVLHSTEANSCSSPSEDISARDLVPPKSPSMNDDCEVPLQQLARLKEKLMRHSRAEDAAMKRIRDLEMQISGLKNELEESNGEKEYMKKQIQEQLVLISDFQIRLDEQRIRAEHIEKQTNTSLELKIYDLQNEIVSLREKLQNKDKTLNHQQAVLSEMQQRLKTLENEISSAKDDEMIVALQKELTALRSENTQLKTKINNEAQIVPNLVENIISDKNIDIEKLREKLNDTEKLLDYYSSLNLDRKELQMLSNIKNSGTSIEEVMSILELSQVDQMRKLDSRNESEALNVTNNLTYKRNSNETVFLGSPDLSTIEKVGPSNVMLSSTEMYKSLEKKVHFEDTDIEKLKSDVAALQNQLENKETVIKEYEERLKSLNNLEEKIEKLQLALEETEKSLASATQTFEKEQQELREKEKNLGVELAEKKLQLSEKEKRIEVLEQDSVRKDEMCMNLAKEKKDLERTLSTLKRDSFKNLDSIIKEKNKEIEELQMSFHSSRSDELESLQQQLLDRNMESISLQSEKEHLFTKLERLQANNRVLEEKLRHTMEENGKYVKELRNNAVQIESVTSEMNSLREKVNKKRRAIKDLEEVVQKQKRNMDALENEIKLQKDVILDRECEIEIANEDAKRYQNDISVLEDKIKELEDGQSRNEMEKLQEDIKERSAKIDELSKEKQRLQELLGEKDKIINQISEDSHKLHVNLVTIQAKLKETGNIVDLGNKLKEEQKRTSELVEEVHELKAQLIQYEAAKKKDNEMTTSVDEITDQLRRELDYSAQIDSNIINAVSDQSLSSISETQDVEIYKKSLAKEKSARRQLGRSQEQLKKQIIELEQKCASLQTLNSELQGVLEKERFVLHQTQSEDAKLIEQMRIQLDTVLDHEEALGKMLDYEKTVHKQLEEELEALKKKHTNLSASSKTESTEYKALPSKEAIELNRLKMNFDIDQEERNKFLSEIKLLKLANGEMENGLKYAQEMLSLELQKCKNLEERLEGVVQAERELRQSLTLTKIELEEKTRENESNKILMEELEQEKAHLSKQKHELLQRLKTQPLPESRNTPIPDVLLNKIKELNSALIDNKKLVDVIQRISNEKRALQTELTEVKGKKGNNVPFNDLVARSDYLFAKTLKLESTKKALIWQKRYLLDYLQGHQKHCLIEALPNTIQYRSNMKTKQPPKVRFRCAVFAVISILRMGYLVRRWHSGVRIAEKVNSRHHKHLLSGADDIPHTQFHVGQPVSSQLFSAGNVAGDRFNVAGSRHVFNLNLDVQDNAFGFYDDGRLSPGSKDSLPWSGNSPPSKDGRSKGRIHIGSNILNKEDMTPLKAPQLLAQFVERFDQIQEKLGVVLDANAT